MRNNSVNYFEFGPVVQEMPLRIFLIWSSGSSVFSGAEPIMQF